ncbi:MAG: hypothetical protein ABJB86_23625 [Bacteroidota bacterium]
MKKRRTIPDNAAQQKIADSIVRKTIGMQEGWAAFMGRTTERIPFRFRKIIILFFFSISGAYSLYLLIFGITAKNKMDIKIDKIDFPKPINNIQNSLPAISDNEFKKIEAFKFYMDSLNKTTEGKTIADSILNNRPGLMDSISQLETIYRANKK